MTTDTDTAVQYLEGLLGRQLRVHTTDTRMFVGVFKCTDAERNIILANSLEYRYPTPSAVQAAANETEFRNKTEPQSATVKVNMTSRLIGLIVIPGQHITKIELELRFLSHPSPPMKAGSDTITSADPSPASRNLALQPRLCMIGDCPPSATPILGPPPAQISLRAAKDRIKAVFRWLVVSQRGMRKTAATLQDLVGLCLANGSDAALVSEADHFRKVPAGQRAVSPPRRLLGLQRGVAFMQNQAHSLPLLPI